MTAGLLLGRFQRAAVNSQPASASLAVGSTRAAGAQAVATLKHHASRSRLGTPVGPPWSAACPFARRRQCAL